LNSVAENEGGTLINAFTEISMKKLVIMSCLIILYINVDLVFGFTPKKVISKYFEAEDLQNKKLYLERLEMLYLAKKIDICNQRTINYLFDQYFTRYIMYKGFPKDDIFNKNSDYFFKSNLKFLDRQIDFYSDFDKEMLNFKLTIDKLLASEDYSKLPKIGRNMNKYMCPKISELAIYVIRILMSKINDFRFDKIENYRHMTIQQLYDVDNSKISCDVVLQHAIDTGDHKHVELMKKITIQNIVKRNNEKVRPLYLAVQTFLNDVNHYNEDFISHLILDQAESGKRIFPQWPVVNLIFKVIVNDFQLISQMRMSFVDKRSPYFNNKIIKEALDRVDSFHTKHQRFPDIPFVYKLENFAY
jgi:hypothetical protein